MSNKVVKTGRQDAFLRLDTCFACLRCPTTIVLMPLVPCLMLRMTHQPHLHQPWRLDRCNSLTRFSANVCQLTSCLIRAVSK